MSDGDPIWRPDGDRFGAVAERGERVPRRCRNAGRGGAAQLGDHAIGQASDPTGQRRRRIPGRRERSVLLRAAAARPWRQPGVTLCHFPVRHSSGVLGERVNHYLPIHSIE